MIDRPSAPNVVANRTDEQTIEVIAALRRLRFTGPEIAEALDRPVATASVILTRIGMGKLGRLGLEPAERYDRLVAGDRAARAASRQAQLRRPVRATTRERGTMSTRPGADTMCASTLAGRSTGRAL